MKILTRKELKLFEKAEEIADTINRWTHNHITVLPPLEPNNIIICINDSLLDPEKTAKLLEKYYNEALDNMGKSIDKAIELIDNRINEL